MFSLSKQENRKLKLWLKKHDKECRFKERIDQGAIGGRLTYRFTPTGIGVIINVSCACGTEIDVTDYELF